MLSQDVNSFEFISFEAGILPTVFANFCYIVRLHVPRCTVFSNVAAVIEWTRLRDVLATTFHRLHGVVEAGRV